MGRSYAEAVRKEIETNEHFKLHLYATPFTEAKPVTGFGKCKEAVKAGKRMHSSFFSDFTEKDARELICQVLLHKSVYQSVLDWVIVETRGVDGRTVAWGGQREFSIGFANPIGFCAKLGAEKPIACSRLTVVLERTESAFKLVTAYPCQSAFGETEYISATKGKTPAGLLRKLRGSEFY